VIYGISVQRTEKEEKPPVKQQASRFSEKASNHFKRGYNCAQSALLAMQEYYDLPKNKLIPKIATPFGGGIGKRGSLCGALTGTVIAVGLKHGTNTTDLKKKEKSYELAQKLYDQFVKTCGSPFCRELIGYDLTKPEDLEKMHKLNVRDKKCCNFVRNAVEILISLETQDNPSKKGRSDKQRNTRKLAGHTNSSGGAARI
jgi:C_GCAxxG_C_C family probable redox protein